ncbi:MAG: membrane dipeptidase [Burkholderiales bacterium]|nr:membrane dipeptidase [Burkholderiales bacterium]
MTTAGSRWGRAAGSRSGSNWQERPYIARSLSLASARKIAAKGGAVGLWTVRVRGDPAYPVHNVRSFADEMVRMGELVGTKHVAFGTDMEGAGPGPILANYVDLREVADNLVQRGMSEAELHGIFIGNYARIVKQAMAGAKP